MYIPVFLLPMPCQTHSPLFHCFQTPATCWLCIAPTLPEHRRTQAWGVNTSERLKHHLLKALPSCSGHGLGPETASLLLLPVFIPPEQPTLPSRQSRRLSVLSCSDQRCFSIPHPWPTHTTEHFRASQRLHSQNMADKNTECTTYLTPTY